MGTRFVASLLAIAACTPTATAPGVEPVPNEPDPEPEFHPHPEIAPDELGDAAVAGGLDASVAPDASYPGCTSLPTPPSYSRPPETIRSGPPVTNRIPPEIVMRPIRARAPCFRACYEAARHRNPSTEGRVGVQFVIELDGWVRAAHVRLDETGDRGLAECIARQFVGLQYPQPDGGRITVVYPVVLAPSDADR
jgi:hypothetical protein